MFMATGLATTRVATMFMATGLATTRVAIMFMATGLATTRVATMFMATGLATTRVAIMFMATGLATTISHKVMILPTTKVKGLLYIKETAQITILTDQYIYTGSFIKNEPISRQML
jgi:uncharacterized membrane protein